MRARFRRLEAAGNLRKRERLTRSPQDLQSLDAADQRGIHRSEYLNDHFDILKY
jgi:hypothetical protein